MSPSHGVSLAKVDHAVITAPGHAAIDSSAADFLRYSFPKREQLERRNSDEQLVSISLPRRELRKKILTDETFRRAFRSLPVQVQDFYVKRAWLFWGKGGLGERMSAKTYVSDVKALGQQRGSLIGSGSLRALQERFESLARWTQVTVLLGTMLAGIGSAFYLAVKAKKVIEEYSEALSAAAQSDAGLERAIQARAGRGPPAHIAEPAAVELDPEATQRQSEGSKN